VTVLVVCVDVCVDVVTVWVASLRRSKAAADVKVMSYIITPELSLSPLLERSSRSHTL
jgi:hypothetical protein